MAHLEEARSEPLCLHTNASTTGFRQLLGWWTHPCAKRMVYPNSTGTEASILRTLPDLFTHLFASFVISFTINQYIEVFPLVLWHILANHQTPGGGHGSPWFIAGWLEVWEAWTCSGHLTWGQSCGTSPEPLGSDGNSRLRLSELSCIVRQENWWAWEKYPHIWCQKCWLE